MYVGWMLGWGASGLPPLPSNCWWTEESGVLAGSRNQLQDKETHTEHQETTIKYYVVYNLNIPLILSSLQECKS